jgi:hypothetical protein
MCIIDAIAAAQQLLITSIFHSISPDHVHSFAFPAISRSQPASACVFKCHVLSGQVHGQAGAAPSTPKPATHHPAINHP